MATFEIPLQKFIDRLRLPEDVQIASIFIKDETVIFEVEGEGKLQLVEVPHSYTQTVNWQTSRPVFVPAGSCDQEELGMTFISKADRS